MFKNHLKIAWRNLIKNKLQTFINLLGLTVGTVSCLIILLYVFEQTGYDQHHDNAESIYRIRTIIKGSGVGGTDFNAATTSPPIAFALKEDFPEVAEACRIINIDGFGVNPIRSTDSKDGFYEPRSYLADSTLFNVFTYKFIEGNKHSALREPNTLVLSSSLSKKLFGNQNALNKTIIWGSGENAQTLIVTGVFDETFGKSHLNPNYIVSMNTSGLGQFVRSVQNFATQNFTYSYLKLNSGSNSNQLEDKLTAFLDAHGAEDLTDAGMEKKTLFLQKITDIHLYSKGIKHQIDKVSNIQYLYYLVTLALFILLVACINFINLSTARANKRAKEIGIRKVVGADKNSLIRQFLGESLLLSMFAITISIPITILLMPAVNNFTQGDLGYLAIFNWQILSLLLGIGIFTGLISGIYPAMVLAAIKPIKVLKSTINLKPGNGNFRRALVVFQFVVSIVLITSVIIISQQFRYTQNKNLGFEKNNLLTIRMNSSDTLTYRTLKSQFLNISGISEIAGSRFSPSENILSDFGLHLPGKNPENKTIVKANGVSSNYFTTMNIPLVQGRDFREGDENQIIVNEATLKAFNIKYDLALGSKILSTYENETQEFEIVGVVSDYHYTSLKDPIGPLMLYKSNYLTSFIVRAESANYQQLLASLEKIWKANVPNVPFSYAFVDQEVEKMYIEEKRLGKISVMFTILAIFISCLGLFGLVSYVAEQKKKEIGIRKVLGASIRSVVKLLTKDFVALVFIAFVIASPIAYFFMQRWLEDFTYRIDINWWVFALAGGFTLIITLLTVGFQSIKSAIANPIKSLRTE